jgi:hypothetical protein
MELNFTKIDNLWVAEFSVSGEFNLHLERNEGGQLNISQRTAGSNYEHIEDAHQLDSRLIFDADFQGLIYPKWIKIKSAVKPLIATITTDGEVNEVVYQAKKIEITSNGTTKVTADTGYTALGSVNVKVNVPTEGGGSDGLKYYYPAENITEDLSDAYGNFWVDINYGLASCVKVADNGSVRFISIKDFEAGGFGASLGAAIDLTLKISFNDFGLMSLEEFFDTIYSSDPMYKIPWRSFLKEITKEEFYNLNA